MLNLRSLLSEQTTGDGQYPTFSASFLTPNSSPQRYRVWDPNDDLLLILTVRNVRLGTAARGDELQGR